MTYRKPEVLAENLRTLYAGLTAPDQVSVTVLSNHPEVEIPPDLPATPRVIVNSTRPVRAWGYLARDWNWALLDCFESWRGSGAQWCVLAQNDVTWLPEWDARLTAIDDLDFISQPVGDQAMAFRLEAVRRIGFFDERFCTLHYQEQDYFLRAILALGDRASINDGHFPWSDWRPTGPVLTELASSGVDADDTLHTSKTLGELGNLLINKWGASSVDQLWDRELFAALVAAGVLRNDRGELDLYPFFWDGCPDPPALARDYLPPSPRYQVSVLVTSDADGDELRGCLDSIVERLGASAYEVIVSTPSFAGLETLVAQSSAPLRVLLHDDTDDATAERQLVTAALAPVSIRLTNRHRL